VRLKQTNLPQQNLEATFARMRAEREREAADEIARGNEAAQRVRAAADRTVVETVSSAQRDAEITRGEADAERNRVFAEAFGSNPEFFGFYRSLAAFERTMQQRNSSLVHLAQQRIRAGDVRGGPCRRSGRGQHGGIDVEAASRACVPGDPGLARPSARARTARGRARGADRKRERRDQLIGTIVLALGLVLVVEGLAFALAPSRIDEALELLRRLRPRRGAISGSAPWRWACFSSGSRGPRRLTLAKFTRH
jgi:hypothetical protein